MTADAGAEDQFPEPPWRTPRKRAARQALSRGAIVAAAMTVLRAEGVDGVSMRRVAQELATGAASLYAHVANKEELLDLLFDEVVGEIAVPEPDPARWREQLVTLWTDSRDALCRHRDIARVAVGRVPVGPNALRVTEATIAILRGAGVPDQVAAWTVDAVSMYLAADAVETAMYTAKQRAGEDPMEYYRQLGEYFAALPPRRFPHMIAIVRELMTGDGEQRFAFGLDLFVRALGTHLR